MADTMVPSRMVRRGETRWTLVRSDGRVLVLEVRGGRAELLAYYHRLHSPRQKENPRTHLWLRGSLCLRQRRSQTARTNYGYFTGQAVVSMSFPDSTAAIRS